MPQLDVVLLFEQVFIASILLFIVFLLVFWFLLPYIYSFFYSREKMSKFSSYLTNLIKLYNLINKKSDNS